MRIIKAEGKNAAISDCLGELHETGSNAALRRIEDTVVD